MANLSTLSNVSVPVFLFDGFIGPESIFVIKNVTNRFDGLTVTSIVVTRIGLHTLVVVTGRTQ